MALHRLIESAAAIRQVDFLPHSEKNLCQRLRKPLWKEERSLIAPALQGGGSFSWRCSWLALSNCSGLCKVAPARIWRQER